MAGHNPDYAEYMVWSVKKVLGCKLYQFSDLKTPAVKGVDEVIRRRFTSPFMVYRFEHIVEFPHKELLLLDSDVVIKKDVKEMFDLDFDVALTVRHQRKKAPVYMPYNSGVMFSKSHEFWVDCLEWVKTQDENHQRWYGDQTAIAHVALGGKHRVLDLPCEEFNWSPSCDNDDSQTARIWHYKGSPRKPWMREAWKLENR